MKQNSRKYIIDTGWQVLIKDMNISAQDILLHARLPLDLFSRKSPTVTGEEYFRLFKALASITRDEPLFPLHLGQAITVEAFSPPIFACFCSDNLNIAVKRLSHYKPLIAPLKLEVMQDIQKTLISIHGLGNDDTVPDFLMLIELVWWVQLTRIATREHIMPKMVYMTFDIPEKEAYEEYFGAPITQSTFNGVSFTSIDANRPFLTASDDMWSIFEPQLNKRMQDLDLDSSFRERVRACLMEILASGQYSMADVASKLAISTRTLQRRLREEGTTFQKELDNLREELARNYLTKSDYSSGQIAFLLGYEEPNSFFRAFRSWTGQTPEVVRATSQP